MSTAVATRDDAYYAGAWHTIGDDTHRDDVSNAADGSLLATVTRASVADVDAAVDAAREALRSWSETSGSERAAALRRLRERLETRADHLAKTIALEVGTPIRIARLVQVGLPIAVVETAALLAEAEDPVVTIGNSRVERRPLGVVGAIVPWNYPLHQLVAKVVFALAAGCTVVVKPSEVAPLSAFEFAEAVHEADLPPGVFNLVPGSGSTVGEALAGHSRIDAVSFTGSVRAGARVAELAASNITRVTLELGGKSASLLLRDADLPTAVRASVNNAFLNSGQTCSAWTRLIVPRVRRDEVLEHAVIAAEKLVVGHPLSEETRLGPLASATQLDRARSFVESGLQDGATLAWQGVRPADLPDGFYFPPAIFADVDRSARIAREEIFGPVLSIITYGDEDEAIDIANDTPYGLAGAVWGLDSEHAVSVARRIRTGQVDINGAAFNPQAPFGGFGHSGYGRELGPFGLEQFGELQSIQI